MTTDLVLGMRCESELIEIVSVAMRLDWFRALSPDEAWSRLYFPMHTALLARLAESDIRSAPAV